MSEKKDKALYVLCEASFMDALRKRAHQKRVPVSRMVRDWLHSAMNEETSITRIPPIDGGTQNA